MRFALVFTCAAALLGADPCYSEAPFKAMNVWHRRPPAEKIFDGKSLEGWEGNRDHWRVEEGAITGEIPAGETLRENQWIYWKDEVHDFELALEYRIEGGPGANSGIQYRSRRMKDDVAAGYQADLDDGTTWLGRIYEEHGRELLVERGSHVSIAPDGRRWQEAFAPADEFKSLPRAGEWNRYRIIAAGTHTEIWINNRRVAVLDDHQLGKAAHSGLIALQLHSGQGPAKVQFRNIYLRKVGETPLAQLPAMEADKEERVTQSPVLWHLRKNPAAPTAIDNAEAQAVVANMKLTEGFQAELIAAEPTIHQPIAFTFDERGRIWVAEAFSYPNKQPAGEGKDRIRILEDSDGDGTFETAKTFAEGLNLVSGLEVGYGGVWVGAAPELLFIADRNHDDQPDGPPEVHLDGFGYQDTHETMNNFAWGPDGWLYGNQGVFNTAQIGKPGAAAEDRVELRAGVWRYHPVEHRFEVFAHGGSNQWGLDFNSRGDLFMTHCRSYWGGGGTTCVIQNGHFWNQANANYPAFVSNAAPPEAPHLKNFLPASAKYDSGEGGAGKPGTNAIYGGHSHVGTMLYQGDNWPEIYRDHLFTHNLHGHQMNHQVNVPQGSLYETFHGGSDVLFVPDPSYVAVDLKYGPDGAVYVIDWVDRQHCHSPRPENWDRTNGRIYRISWAKTYRPVTVDLRSLSDEELVDLFEHRNRWYAEVARRLLHERSLEKPLAPELVKRLEVWLYDEGDPVRVLDGLWALHLTGNLTEKWLQVALEHMDDSVCSWAIRLGTEARPALVSREQLRPYAEHLSPKVRLALATALPKLPPADRWELGALLANQADDASDRFLPGMVWFALAPLVDDDVSRALVLAESTSWPTLKDSIYWYVARHAEGREALVNKMLDSADDEAAGRMLAIMHFSLSNESDVPRPERWAEVVKRFESAANRRSRSRIEELSITFHDEPTLARMRRLLVNDDAPAARRRSALEHLARINDRGVLALLPTLLDDAAFRAQVIPLLARTNDGQVAQKLLALLPSLPDDERSAALGVLTSRQEFALRLLAAVDSQQLDRTLLSALHIRRMHDLGSDEVSAILVRLWGKIGTTTEDARKTIERVNNMYTTAPLWAYEIKKGRQVFEKTCANCHPLDGQTTPLGPSLAGSWRHGLGYFLENIVDPNAVIGENYRATIIETDAGLVESGLVESETETTVVLRTADKTISIPKSEIESRTLSEQSLMPTGLLDAMSETETIELLLFLLHNK